MREGLCCMVGGFLYHAGQRLLVKKGQTFSDTQFYLIALQSLYLIAGRVRLFSVIPSLLRRFVCCLFHRQAAATAATDTFLARERSEFLFLFVYLSRRVDVKSRCTRC